MDRMLSIARGVALAVSFAGPALADDLPRQAAYPSAQSSQGPAGGLAPMGVAAGIGSPGYDPSQAQAGTGTPGGTPGSITAGTGGAGGAGAGVGAGAGAGAGAGDGGASPGLGGFAGASGAPSGDHRRLPDDLQGLGGPRRRDKWDVPAPADPGPAAEPRQPQPRGRQRQRDDLDPLQAHRAEDFGQPEPGPAGSLLLLVQLLRQPERLGRPAPDVADLRTSRSTTSFSGSKRRSSTAGRRSASGSRSTRSACKSTANLAGLWAGRAPRRATCRSSSSTSSSAARASWPPPAFRSPPPPARARSAATSTTATSAIPRSSRSWATCSPAIASTSRASPRSTCRPCRRT